MIEILWFKSREMSTVWYSVISPFQPQTPPLLSSRRQELDVRPQCTGHRIGRLHLTQVSGGHPPKPARSLVALFSFDLVPLDLLLAIGLLFFNPSTQHKVTSLSVVFIYFSSHFYNSPNGEIFLLDLSFSCFRFAVFVAKVSQMVNICPDLARSCCVMMKVAVMSVPFVLI